MRRAFAMMPQNLLAGESVRALLILVLLLPGWLSAASIQGRLSLIADYGTSVPYWDQWGAEGGALYLPMVDGNYDWRQLWTAHNEHRIAASRLLAMGLFRLNDGQWDGRVESNANVIIYLFSIGLLAWLLVRRTPWPLASGSIRAAAVLLRGGDVARRRRRAVAEQELLHLGLQERARLRIARHQPVLVDQHGLVREPFGPRGLADLFEHALAERAGPRREVEALGLDLVLRAENGTGHRVFARSRPGAAWHGRAL